MKNEEEYIKISVVDNGVGIDEEKLENILSEGGKKGSVGIKNIHRRLIKLYGRGLIITKGIDNGTKIEFFVPYIKSKEEL